MSYFLRPIDFRPEQLTEDKLPLLGCPSIDKAVEQLAEYCNLFNAEAEIQKRNDQIRESLRLNFSKCYEELAHLIREIL